MSYHIIGFGNMGKRYEKILLDKGYSVTHNDINEEVRMDATHYLICTPPNDHVREALPHLINGKRVMIEKPIAITLEALSVLEPYKDQIWHVSNYWDWDLSKIEGEEALLFYNNTYPEGCVPHYLDLIHYVSLMKKYDIHGEVQMDFTIPVRGVGVYCDGKLHQEPFPYTECLERTIDHFINGDSNFDNAVESLKAIINPKKVSVNL